MAEQTRREAMHTLLFGLGATSLAALATGVPARVWRATDAPSPAPFRWPRLDGATALIWSSHEAGCPLNANVPGTYTSPGVLHPAQLAMAPTSFSLGAHVAVAAAPWASLSEATRARTVFFHHATHNVVHADREQVDSLQGAVRGGAPLDVAMASALAPRLQTVLSQPVWLEGTNADDAPAGRVARNRLSIAPSAVAHTLLAADSSLTSLSSTRARLLDALHKKARLDASPAWRRRLDDHVQSEHEMRQARDALFRRAHAMQADDTHATLQAAIVMAQWRLAPVLRVAIGFGGDTHSDPNLCREVQGTREGVAHLHGLVEALRETRVHDEVTILALNPFGRTLAVEHKGRMGRDHNAHHNVAVAIGPHLQGGVVGGIKPHQGDWHASAIDGRTGAATDEGDIASHQTLASAGKTLAAACGLSLPWIDESIAQGRVVDSALVPNAQPQLRLPAC